MKYAWVFGVLCLVFRVGTCALGAGPPPLIDEPPAPGKFVKMVAPEYVGTAVYHGLFLPAAWRQGKLYPVIVEFAPNKAPQFGTTGRVDECRLGYSLAEELDCLWLVMPYVNAAEKRNQETWWGDRDATVRYLKLNLPRVLESYGGDTKRLVLCGFSRGAIACGYLGLYDDESAKFWRGFIAHSHFDGGRFTPDGANERLARFAGRPVLISYGENDNGRADSHKQAELLREKGWGNVTELMIVGDGHSDRWASDNRPERQAAVAWLKQVIK